MKAPELDLYFFDACPYCQRVLKVINKHKIKVNYKDIYEDLNNLQKSSLWFCSIRFNIAANKTLLGTVT